MSGVGAFVHLYHVWGLFGLLTAVLFGQQGYKNWRASGGTWRTAPGEWIYATGWLTGETLRDIWRLFKWFGKAFVGLPLDWQQSEWRGRVYSRQQIILVGITLGGLSRFLTALYWSERNRDWMQYADSWMLQMATVPIVLAVLGDFHHHMTAWPNKLHRTRLVAVSALAWVVYGAFKG